MSYKRKASLYWLVGFLVMAILLASCTDRDRDLDDPNDWEEDVEGVEDVEDIDEQETNEVHVRMYLSSAFDSHIINDYPTRQGTYSIVQLIEEYVSEHLPEIQLTVFSENPYPLGGEDGPKRDMLAEMMESEGGPPDIIIDLTHQIPFLLENELIAYDMNDLAGLHGLDVNIFEEAFIEQLQLAHSGSLYALPLIRSVHAIRYFPEALEQLEIPFPHDDMSWEEFIVWIDYALQQGSPSLLIEPRLLLAQQEINAVHLHNGEVSLDREIWNQLISMYRILYPSFFPLESRDEETWLYSPREGEGSMADEWELMAFPTFADYPGISPDYVSSIIVPSAYTNHLDEVMQVIALLVSEGFQVELSRIGLGSPLRAVHVHEQFGEGTAEYPGKNVDAFFKHRPTSHSIFSIQELTVSQIVYPYLDAISREGANPEAQLDLLLEELERLPIGGE